MFTNYLKLFFRNLMRKRVYAIINIIGLALGLASFLIILLYITDELSYDKHHSRADRIYRIGMIYDFGGVGEESASQPFPFAFTFKEEYPHLIADVVRITNLQLKRNLIQFEDKKFNERRFYLADSTFFKIFDYQFIQGDPNTALNEPNSVVITESTARRYFGDADPMGQILKYEVGTPFKVTGVIKDVPAQSHFVFDLIASFSTIKRWLGPRQFSSWVWNPCWTYVLLREGVTIEQVEANYENFIDKYFYDAQRESISLFSQQLPKIHLHSHLDYEIEPNSNITYIVILMSIGIFILIIACINFMNLATATAGTRAREIGIRKVTGAYWLQLVIQFIGESLIIAFFAFVLAVIIVEFTLPYFNDFAGKSIDLSILVSSEFIPKLILLWLAVGILSGLYPAFYLSAFQPISVLRGIYRTELKNRIARKLLVVLQFVISISVIITSLMIFRQLNYLKNFDIGFDKKNIIMIPIQRTAVSTLYEVYKKEILQHSNVVSVTAVDDIIGSAHNTHEFVPEGVDEKDMRFFPALVVRNDFVKTFGIEIVAGRDYDEELVTDAMEAILINESMVKHLGWKSNEEAIGKKFSSMSGKEKVVGVFKDFHPTSLHQASGPFVLNIKETPGEIQFFLNYVAVKLGEGDRMETIEFLKKKWEKIEEYRPFEYVVLEDELAKMYDDERRLSVFAFVLSLVTILISAMGLFGLASYTTERRTREIGIRKVFGASEESIVAMLTMDFLKVVLVSSVLAWPVAYFIVTSWLKNFAYAASLSIVPFLLAVVGALVVAWLTVSLKAIRAAISNPVDALRYE